MQNQAGQNLTALACFGNMPKIRQVTIIFVSVMMSFSLVGLAVDDVDKGVFSIVYFFAPITWMLWIWCALQAGKERVGLVLVLIWVAIDFSILINLMSLTTLKASQSLGTDVTILVAYLPVLLPVGFLHAIIPDGFSLSGVVDSQEGYGALIRVWGEATIWAAVQSFFIYWIGRFSWKSRKGRNQ